MSTLQPRYFRPKHKIQDIFYDPQQNKFISTPKFKSNEYRSAHFDQVSFDTPTQ